MFHFLRFSSTPTPELTPIRSQIANVLLMVGTVLSWVAVLAFLNTARVSGFNMQHTVSVLLIVVLTALTMSRDRIPYDTRALLLVVLPFLGGVSNALTLGIANSGMMWFLISVFLAATLFDTRTAWVVSGLTIVFMLVIMSAVLSSTFIPDDPAGYPVTLATWLAQIINLLLLQVIVIVVMGSIIQTLHEKIVELDASMHRVQEQTDELNAEVTRHEATQAELEEYLGRLRELDILKNEMIDSIAHELRTPITNVKLYHQLLRRRPDKYTEYISILTKETDRLDTIVEEMLFSIGMKRRLQSTTMIEINLNELVRSDIELAQKTLDAHRVKLDFIPAKSPIKVFGSRTLLARVCWILVDNAIKYTPEGERVEVRVLSSVDHDDRKWHGIRVTNWGVHLSDSEADHVFDRFFRGKDALNDQIPGVGLGLAIAQDIVKMYDGEVILNNADPNAVTFTVLLPHRSTYVPEDTLPEKQ